MSAMPKENGKGKGKESEPNDRAEALLDLSISLIDQALDILNRHLKEDRQMTHSSKLMPGGSVGKHFRHVRLYISLPSSTTKNQVMEMFRALLVPLQPNSPSIPSGVLQVNYDAILPSSRRPLARSISSCRKAMQGIRDDLQAWKIRSSEGGGVGEGVAGEVGLGGLIGDMQREVLLIAVTPTEQEMKSSVGREVRLSCTCFGRANVKLWFCALHAIHHFSMLRTIAVYELVSILSDMGLMIELMSRA
jgi:hypothetical protein